VRREHLLDDAFSTLRGLGSGWRMPVRVRFLGLDNLEEAGVGEGVAKEFLGEVLRAGFDPAFGLFREGAEGALLPHPAAPLLRRNSTALYEFLGAVLGKTLYEGILVELPLAACFLNRLLSRTNTINDLPTLDPVLYRSLLFLKSFDGDFESLCLTFSIDEFSDDDVPPERRRQVALRPGGAEMGVTRDNRVEYIFLVAHYRLNVQMRRACDAFLRGFESVVPRTWIHMFSPAELQMVLGGSDAPLDLSDWHANTTYSGGYTAQHQTVLWFWEVLADFDAGRRAATLKFATSCSRPPLMGFKWLQPPFHVHMATAEHGRLPTSATCMNLLKLPPYDSREMLREKLTYAIEAGAGFELS